MKKFNINKKPNIFYVIYCCLNDMFYPKLILANLILIRTIFNVEIYAASLFPSEGNSLEGPKC